MSKNSNIFKCVFFLFIMFVLSGDVNILDIADFFLTVSCQ